MEEGAKLQKCSLSFAARARPGNKHSQEEALGVSQSSLLFFSVQRGMLGWSAWKREDMLMCTDQHPFQRGQRSGESSLFHGLQRTVDDCPSCLQGHRGDSGSPVPGTLPVTHQQPPKLALYLLPLANPPGVWTHRGKGQRSVRTRLPASFQTARPSALASTGVGSRREPNFYNEQDLILNPKGD